MEVITESIKIHSKEPTAVSNAQIIGISGNNNIIISYTHKDAVMFYCYETINNISIYNEILSNSSLWRIEYKIENGYRNTTYNNYEYIIKIIIKLDITLVSDYIKSSLGLKNIIYNKYNQLNDFTNTSVVNKSYLSPIINYTDITEILLKINIQLYEYQKYNLIKMLEIEKFINTNKIIYSYDMLFDNYNVKYDPLTNNIIDNDLFMTIKTKGGILADEMGLGKTVTSIALIIANPSPPIIDNMSKNNKFNTKATLIICPSHLTKQWESEILKCTNTLNILLILSKKEYLKLTFSDFINADVIITSHQFLMNFKFYPTLYYKECTATRYNFNERVATINKFLLNSLCDYTYDEMLTLTEPLFEFFNFYRLILDEGHELFSELVSISLSKYMSQWLSLIDSTNYWYISGTPMINYNCAKNVVNFIKLEMYETKTNIKFTYNTMRDIPSELTQFLSKEYLWDNILNTICIRHCKSDVLNQINILNHTEVVHWIEFTDIEKQLYNTKINRVSDTELLQLCCHPLVLESNRRMYGETMNDINLSDIQAKLIGLHKSNYIKYKIKLSKLATNTSEYHLLKKKYETCINESHYIYTILEKMANKDDTILNDTCPICMDTLILPTLTNCGHIFCNNCIKLSYEHKKECPICKHNFSEFYLIDANNDKSIIDKYGSKLGNIILIIKKLLENTINKIIIFSQWNHMLSLIGKTLSDNNILFSIVKGNVYMRNHAITKFSSSEDRVILLSLNNAASGTNLVEATHIFFIEPINLPYTEIQSIENQAIGRVCRIGQKYQVEVIRILIKNTIEENIYNTYYKKND